MKNVKYFQKKIQISNNLPFTTIVLNDWVLVIITGQDSFKYLQSKLTIDINDLKLSKYLLGAHCDQSGKVWTTMYIFLFQSKEKFGYIIRKSLYKQQISELKKYSIFSKVEISIDKNLFLLGITGFKARKTLSKILKILPNKDNKIIYDDNVIILWIEKPLERFLIITNKKFIKFIKKSLKDKNIFYTSRSDQWKLLDIEAGLPVIDFQNSKKFLPQFINLHKLNAINFKKGCYLGQEIIAKTQFLKKNKKGMYWLSGYTNNFVKDGDIIESKINNKWYLCGVVLSSVRIEKNRISIQAVLKKDFLNILRLKNDKKSALFLYKSNNYLI